MACGILSWQEGFMSSPAIPFTFKPGAGRDSTGIRYLPPPSLTTMCRITPVLIRTSRPLSTSSRFWPLLPASWRLRQGRTTYVQPWWGEQMGNKRPLLSRNPAWLCSPRIPTSPGSTHKNESETRYPLLNRTPKIRGVTLDTQFTFCPYAGDCVERASKTLNVMKTPAVSSWCFSTIKRPSCTLFGSFKCPPPIWTSFRWSRIRSEDRDRGAI